MPGSTHGFRTKEQFDVFIYNNASREDDKTELFKSLVLGPRSESGRPNRAHPCTAMDRASAELNAVWK